MSPSDRGEIVTTDTEQDKEKVWEGADTVERLTPEEITELARDSVTNLVFITNSQDGINLSFGLVLSLLLPKAHERYIESIGAVYEYISKAGPRSINGMPMFTSVRFLHIEDMPLLTEERSRLKAAIEE
ncbi:hypothetical protein LCGC14_1276410 [marine sediment metagenome]|uniref:Uncharacterized protein n=1 Tax=marine sediment metagenome TaxID=412755 RepID=A0A0F9ND49_9ZZZZ